MSTRGLYGFRKGGMDKTTYNHSDSYPEWLGDKISKLCVSCVPDKMSAFFDRITLVEECGKPNKAQQEFCMDSGWYNPNVGERSPEDWYCLLRELQGNITELDKAIRGSGVFFMIDNHDFIKDSLFCEYAYIINLDSGNLEFWKGFQKEPDPENRYGCDVSERCDWRDPVVCYYPCRIALEIPLDDTAALANAVPAMIAACKEDRE